MHFSLRIILTSKGSLSGECTISGLPFTSSNTFGNFGSCMISFANNFSLQTTTMFTIDQNSALIRPRFISGTTYSNYTPSQFENNTDLILTGSYQANV